MNIVRDGHFYVGNATGPVDVTDCSAAKVVHAEDGKGKEGEVNLIWYGHDGHGPYIETSVPVDPSTHPVHYSFHLSGDCPWKR